MSVPCASFRYQMYMKRVFDTHPAGMNNRLIAQAVFFERGLQPLYIA